MKKEIRNVIVARNIIKHLGDRYSQSQFAQMYLNQMSVDMLIAARLVHKHLPYYIVTGRI